MKVIIIFSILATALGPVRGEYPANFPKCHYADESCLVHAANEVIQNYFSGLRELNLPPFDPLHIRSMLLPRNPSSPVNIETLLTDIELSGMKTANVSSFKGLREDLSGRNVLSGTIDELDFRGHYKIDGHVLILPIVGDGLARFTCKKLRFNFSYDLNPVKKNDKIFATLRRVKLDLEPEHVHFEFDNLFNGDKTLTDTMNQFVNANWREIYGELKPGLSKAMGIVIKTMGNSFLEKYPYADYFL